MQKRIIIQGRPFSSEPSGFKTFSKNFISQLAKKLPDCIFEILTPALITDDLSSYPTNLHTHTLSAAPTDPDYFSMLAWENVLTSKYVAQKPDDILFYLSPYNCLPLEKLPVPEFVVLHDTFLWTEQRQWSEARQLGYQIKKKSIYNAEKVFTVSNYSKSTIEEFFSFSQEHVVNISEDIDPFYKKVHTTLNPTNKKYFLYVGSLEPRKNIALLIEAYKRYRQGHTEPADLVLVAGQTTRTSSEGIPASQASEGIIYKTTQSQEELYQLYQHALAFIYPSLLEGFGLQILEAQHMGCPVLASDIPVFHEIAGDSIVYFDPTNPQELAEHMNRIATQTSLRQDVIASGHKNTKNYSWEATVDTFLSSISSYL